MKTLRTLILLAAAGCALSASADNATFTFTNGFANGGVVPDGNTTGWFDTRTVAGLDGSTIANLSVSLNISGGYAGDFYVYLAHDSGFTVLLNRVGRTAGNSFGYGDAGLNLTLDDSAANGDIHLFQTVGGFATLIANGGVWGPDGRNVSPLTVLDTTGRTSLLDQFSGLDPNGDWTLFVADVSGGEQGAVVSWGLNLTMQPTAVPEPSASALCFAGLGVLLWWRKKSRA